MTTKKSVALIIVLMMVLSALAGCSSTKTNTPGEATKAPASVEGNAETSADKTLTEKRPPRESTLRSPC